VYNVPCVYLNPWKNKRSNSTGVDLVKSRGTLEADFL
jgi:hypothetical protein